MNSCCWIWLLYCTFWSSSYRVSESSGNHMESSYNRTFTIVEMPYICSFTCYQVFLNVTGNVIYHRVYIIVRSSEHQRFVSLPCQSIHGQISYFSTLLYIFLNAERWPVFCAEIWSSLWKHDISCDADWCVYADKVGFYQSFNVFKMAINTYFCPV